MKRPAPRPASTSFCVTEGHPLADDFRAFREECAELAILLNTFDRLFDDKNYETLKEASHYFFFDLNSWLIELFIVKCHRLLDSASTGKRDNLSVFFFERELGQGNDEIKRLACELRAYLEPLRSVRNRIVAHADRETIMNQIACGQHDLETHQKFRMDLQSFCDEVGRAVGIGPSEFINISPQGVFPLLKTLESGLEKRQS